MSGLLALLTCNAALARLARSKLDHRCNCDCLPQGRGRAFSSLSHLTSGLGHPFALLAPTLPASTSVELHDLAPIAGSKPRMYRRNMLLGSALLPFASTLARVLPAYADETTAFDGSTVRNIARQMAQHPYQAPDQTLPIF